MRMAVEQMRSLDNVHPSSGVVSAYLGHSEASLIWFNESAYGRMADFLFSSGARKHASPCSTENPFDQLTWDDT